MRLDQSRSVSAAGDDIVGISCLLSCVTDIDQLTYSGEPTPLPLDSGPQFACGSGKHVVPAGFELATNLAVCTDGGNVGRNPRLYRLRHVAAAKDSGETIDLEFGVAKLAHGFHLRQ